MKKGNATQRAKANIREIHQLISQLNDTVSEHRCATEAGAATWGTVGDLAYIRQQLRGALGIEDESDPR